MWAAAAFRALLSETVLRAGPAPSFGEARSRLRHEPRWQGVTSVEARQALYAELAEQLSRRWAAEKKREADDEDDVEAKRQRCRFDVAEQSFRSLLAKKVKTPLDFSWKEATMILEGEELPELPEVDLETIFHEVRTEELQRRLRAFAAFLRSSSHGPEQSFGQALVGAEELLQSVPVAEAKKCWEDWRRWRLTEAEEEFKAWLRQSELLSAQVPTEGPAFEAFCESLANDLRYQRLAPVPSTRKRLILQRLQAEVVWILRRSSRHRLAQQPIDLTKDEERKKRLQLTEPSDAKCCKSTCGAFSCPAGAKVPASKERKVGSSPAECCDTLCGGYSCGKGYQADPLKAARFGNTDEVCCRRTCAIYQCNVGWAPKKNVENFVDVGDEICCQKKCVQYQEKCTGDFAPNPDANETIGDTADVCCSGTCALHSCGSGVLIPEPQVTVGAIDELCCEDGLGLS
ncbi:unnamed protein product [Effrenium voratum]|nr:unnamed protein product [Effrenium voratum]